MSVQITINLPEGSFFALRKNYEEFVKEMRLAAAVKWYELGMISQSRADEIAGISRHEFLVTISLLGKGENGAGL